MVAHIKVAVVRGHQGNHDFYIGSISAGLLTHIVRFTDPSLPPKERAQRVVSLPDAKEISDYILENPNFHFNNIELAILGQATFDPIAGHPQHGYLEWLEDTPVVIFDGQTRTKAFELAIAIRRAIATGEDVKVAFELQPEIERRRQVASDLNLKQRRFSRALAKYFDSYNPESVIVRLTLEALPAYQNVTDVCNDTVAKNSEYLFPYNGFYKATSYLLQGQEDRSIEAQVDLAADFWTAVLGQMPDWTAVVEGEMKAKDARNGRLHSQAIVLEAIGCLGSFLLQRYSKTWQQKLAGLDQVNWNRDASHWDRRVIFGRTIKKDRLALLGIVSYLKSCLSLPLNDEEQAFERDWQKSTAP